MQLSIIIINFNTYQITANCISSIIRHTRGIDYEMILVDNFPVKDYKKDFLELCPSLQYLRSDKNIGFGRANNLGMSIAKGDFLLLLNSDTLLQDNNFLMCLNFLNSPNGQSVGLLGCKLLNADGSYQASFYPYTKHFFWNYCISNNVLLHKIFNVAKAYESPGTVKNVGDVSGAFMMLRKEIFKDTGGFDPDFFLYYEETDWCRNRIHPKYRIVYFPDAAIIHLGGQSAPKTEMQLQASISQSLYWYKKGWPSYIGFIVFNFLNAIFYLFQYPFAKAKSKQSIRSVFKSLRLSIPYWLFNIPKWPRRFGSRAEPLIFKGARPIFFDSKETKSDN